MSWLRWIFGTNIEIVRPWDTRARHRNQHCGSEQCTESNGCLCLCDKCGDEWQQEFAAAGKMFEEHRELYKLAKDVMNAPNPAEALLARKGVGSPEPNTTEWSAVMGQLDGMNTSYKAECDVMAGRYRAMARETASEEDAARYRNEAEYWAKGGFLTDENIDASDDQVAEFEPYFMGEHVQLYRFPNGHVASVAMGLDGSGKSVAVIKVDKSGNPLHINYKTAYGPPRDNLTTGEAVHSALAEIAALAKAADSE